MYLAIVWLISRSNLLLIWVINSSQYVIIIYALLCWNYKVCSSSQSFIHNRNGRDKVQVQFKMKVDGAWQYNHFQKMKIWGRFKIWIQSWFIQNEFWLIEATQLINSITIIPTWINRIWIRLHSVVNPGTLWFHFSWYTPLSIPNAGYPKINKCYMFVNREDRVKLSL